MKKIVLLIAATCFAINAQAQDKRMLALFEAIEGNYVVDDNDNVTLTRTIELPGMDKDAIFLRAQNYFAYNYGDANSVVQVQDKEKGVIVGKGIYNAYPDKKRVKELRQTEKIVVPACSTNVWHILRVDVKDGKARIILSLTEYEREKEFSTEIIRRSVAKSYPVNKNEDSDEKNVFPGKQRSLFAFYFAYEGAEKIMGEVEKTLKGGSTSSDIENEDW